MAKLLLSVVLCIIFAFITIEAQDEGPVMYCQQSLCQPCWVIEEGYAAPAAAEVDGEFIDNEYTSSSTCTLTSDTTFCTDYCNDVWDAWQACGMELEVGPSQWITFPDCVLYDCFDPPCPTEKRSVRNIEDTNGFNLTFIWWVTGQLYNSSAMTNATIPRVVDPEPKPLGCWEDNEPRDLDIQGPDVYSVDDCISYCSGLLYPYAGLQDGGQCFCGHKYDSYGPSDNCDVECPDDEDCGGGWANMIYWTGWMGCYHDSPSRDMTMINDGSGGAVTVESCRSDCLTAGYKYAAPQDGNQCSCANSCAHQGLATGSCFVECNGNNEEYCGGGYANAIFTAKQTVPSK